ncbi:lipoprotein-releasing system permease protein [Caulobacter sp. BE264]|uniref:ABC transporter permease n=1 Tax=Caulobacter sp. BE264 TaxID=2817724 RepID=UPI002863D6E5|nr:ABC transporter permease [Caulobacter sp. BE264]MDR7232308.1 lipoprotein-releasing system permease protein [Caulobacter sp. BE264]
MFAFKVARRYLLSNPSQTLLLIAGVALGVTVFIFITALIAGLAVRLTDQVTGNSAHVSLQPATRVARVLPGPDLPVESVALVSTFQRQQIRDWPMVIDLLRANPEVSAISPQISGSAFLVKSEAVAPVAVLGVEPQGIDAISRITPNIIEGDGDLGANGLLIGVRMAEELGLGAGQSVLLRTERGVERQLTVRGVFRTGLQSLDERVAFLSLQTARPLFDLPEGVTNIEVKLKDPQDARATARFLGEATGLRATPWQEKNVGLEDALKAQGQTGTMIQIFSLISIIIGIASALVLSAYRRRSEVGIMRAFGVPGGFILWVFLLQGLLIGLVGALIGCASGYGLCTWLESITRPDGTSILPIAPRQGGYAAALVLTTLGAVIASILPARSASKIDPLEAIQQ